MASADRSHRLGTAAAPALAAALAAALAVAPGCVDRFLQIRSEPPGADVYVNGERAGTTPLDHRFDFYGTFDITVRSSGRKSVHRLEKVFPPWYEIPPIDFVSENLVPFPIRDRREVTLALEEAPALTAGGASKSEEVEARRSALRARARELEARIDGPGREAR